MIIDKSAKVKILERPKGTKQQIKVTANISRSTVSMH